MHISAPTDRTQDDCYYEQALEYMNWRPASVTAVVPGTCSLDTQSSPAPSDNREGSLDSNMEIDDNTLTSLQSQAPQPRENARDLSPSQASARVRILKSTGREAVGPFPGIHHELINAQPEFVEDTQLALAAVQSQLSSSSYASLPSAYMAGASGFAAKTAFSSSTSSVQALTYLPADEINSIPKDFVHTPEDQQGSLNSQLPSSYGLSGSMDSSTTCADHARYLRDTISCDTQDISQTAFLKPRDRETVARTRDLAFPPRNQHSTNYQQVIQEVAGFAPEADAEEHITDDGSSLHSQLSMPTNTYSPSGSREETFLPGTEATRTLKIQLRNQISENTSPKRKLPRTDHMQVVSQPHMISLSGLVPSRECSNTGCCPNLSSGGTDTIVGTDLDLTTLAFEVFSPSPRTGTRLPNTSHTQITPTLARLMKNPEIMTRFCPVRENRPLHALERGHWSMDPSTWLRSEQYNFWIFLSEIISSGRAGASTWCSRERDSRDNLGKVKIFCWGEIVPHIYLLMYAGSEGLVKGISARWIDASGEIIVQMK